MGLKTSTVINALFIQIDNLDRIPFDFVLSERQKETETLRQAVSLQENTHRFENEEDFNKYYDDAYGK